MEMKQESLILHIDQKREISKRCARLAYLLIIFTFFLYLTRMALQHQSHIRALWIQIHNLLETKRASSFLPEKTYGEVDALTLKWTFSSPAPWTFHNQTKIWSSFYLSEAIASFLEEPAPGLSGYTYKSALMEFQSRGCAVFLHGGAIRDALLHQKPNDFDIEYACSYEEFAEICQAVFGENCQLHSSKTKFELGPAGTVHPLEGVSWNKTIQAPSYTYDFTMNYLSYDLNGNEVIYDFEEEGMEAVLSKTLKIPGPQDQWNKWLFESSVFKLNGIRKLPRYFKFSGDHHGFSPTPETRAFVVNATIALWNDTVWKAGDKFRDYFCALISGRVDPLSKNCNVVAQPSEKAIIKQQYSVSSMIRDLGQEFVHVNVISAGMLRYAVQSQRSEELNITGHI